MAGTAGTGLREARSGSITSNKMSQRAWIERVFSKRECVRFVPSQRDKNRCGCGRLFSKHYYHQQGQRSSPLSSTQDELPHPEKWNVYRHSELSSTDAFGTIEFQGGPHPTKAQYVRLSHDTRPDLIMQLFQKQWMLELPKLLISVHGGIANFDLQPKLKRVFRKGLLKAAKTTGAWIVTGGTNTGVMRHVGDSLGDTLQQARNNVVTIGCAPWGVVDNRDSLLGRDTVTPYHAVACPKSNNVVLNSNHSYFLLVDNGTVGKYGGEILLRKKLEKHISLQKITTRSSTKNHGIPVVVVILEGGTNTIRTVLECVTDTPPVPVVVCDGSGRAADLLAFTHKYAQDEGTMAEGLRDQLLLTIEKTFQYTHEQAEKLFIELMLCVKKKELITVFRMGEGSQDIDLAILTALLKGQNASAPDQLSLALSWNRVDIARSHIFVYGQDWPEGALEQAMMDALVNDRVDFVQLLLENGISMQKFLTIPRLEELYNIKQGHINTIRLMVCEVKKHVPPGYRYTLFDIGLVIEYLMGGAYRASYLRRKFRNLYCAVMKKGHNIGTLLGDLPLPIDAQQFQKVFRYPFHELMVWAVLMRRQKMALFMWQHGEEALAKALVAMRLYKRLAHEAAQDDLEVEVSEELKQYSREFATLAVELLEHCYQTDDDITEQLLTYELAHWSDQTNLSLALCAVHRDFLANTCCQILLTDMWMGGLRMRKYTSIKVILGILIPFTICMLAFKTREELQMMPQTVEEHIQELEDSDSEESVNLEYTDEQSEMGIGADHTDTHIPHPAENGKLISDVPHTSFVTFERKKRSLTIGKKIYEFYNAPVTKFWAHTMSYLAFLMFFTHEVIVKLYPMPRYQEIIVITYIFTLGLEKIREIISSEPTKIGQKIAVYFSEFWNIWDAIAILLFTIGMGLRLNPSTQMDGRVFYCVNIIFWYVRILDIFSVNKYLGPYVMIVGKMVKDTLTFVIILLVVLMSFGVARQGLRNPNELPHWQLARDIFLEPYFMLYGEVYAPDIDPPCGGGNGEPECLPGKWVTPAIMTVYLIVANILLINLLIAVFNNTFNRVNAISRQIWKFQRYSLVIEFEQKPILPPPLIVICHVYLAVKYIYRRCKGKRKYFDNGLKLFLDEEDVEKLHDFEEECMEDLFREKEVKCNASRDERIRLTNERVENMSLRMDDMNLKENSIKMSLQTVDYRLAKLEELALQTAESLNSIQEFLYMSYTGSSPRPPEVKLRGHLASMTSTSREPSVDEEGLELDVNPTLLHMKMANRNLASQASSPLVIHSKKKHTERRLGPFTDYSRSLARPSFSRSMTVAAPGYYDMPPPRSSPIMSLIKRVPAAEKAVKIAASDGFGGPPHLTSSLYHRRRSRALSKLKTQPFKGKVTRANSVNTTKPSRAQSIGSPIFSVPQESTKSGASTPKVKFRDLPPDVTASKHDNNSVFTGVSASTHQSEPCDHEAANHKTSIVHGHISDHTTSVQEDLEMKDTFKPISTPDVCDNGVVSSASDARHHEIDNYELPADTDANDIAEVDLPKGLMNEQYFITGSCNLPNRISSRDSLRASRMPMTPILTPLRADYTSITDEIDTSCIIGDSPRSSPVPSSAHHFFYDDEVDEFTRTGSPEKEAIRTELEQLKLAEETEHRQLEGIIRNRMRQISLTESDSLSDIAKHVMQEMELLNGGEKSEGTENEVDGTTDEDQYFDAADEGANAETTSVAVKRLGRRRHKSQDQCDGADIANAQQSPSPATVKRQAFADRDEHAITVDSTC